MAVASTSSSLHLLPLLLVLLLAATSEATTFKIINQCSYTVWPAALPGGGVKLDPGETWALNVPAGTLAGRIWARTGCSLLGEGGSCQTGDCSGLLACTVSGRSPNTLGEFSLGQGESYDDFFDISLTNGFNVPMDFLPVPVQGRSGCSKGPRCAANITSQCPRELKAPGGCNNACTRSTASSCSYTNYSAFFKYMCPDAYSRPDDNSTYACPSGTEYQVIFCPLINQTLLPTAESPLPAPPAEATPPTPSTLPTAIGPTSMKPKSPSGRRVVAILAPLGGFILLTILFLVAFFICKRRTQQQHEMEEEEEFGELQGTPMRFTFQQLRAATKQFAYKLGEGGFGSVFKGQFGDQRIAVKRLDRTG
ncbi:alpha-amylase/trypsin inhibitor-like [Aegilops tauschii subsp. strangulata]|uniref:Protein kinase domain-containing protein n=2 Tax=Aegilops tauschii subsp. strangulata TaxID=200361 RepID=A0A453DX53_AEGTS